jgi:hypothetical protein
MLRAFLSTGNIFEISSSNVIFDEKYPASKTTDIITEIKNIRWLLKNLYSKTNSCDIKL